MISKGNIYESFISQSIKLSLDQPKLKKEEYAFEKKTAICYFKRRYLRTENKVGYPNYFLKLYCSFSINKSFPV